MNRMDYPLYSSGNIDQHAELWGLIGRSPISQSGHHVSLLHDVVEPRRRLAAVHGWATRPENGVPQPLHETDGRPEELPRPILDYIEKHHSEYLTAPREWNGPQMTSSAQVFKAMVDKRRAEGN